MSERLSLPTAGLDGEHIVARARDYGSEDVDFAGGRTWSLVYWPGEEHHRIVEEAHNLYLAKNALNPLAFKGLKRLETEVVQMCAGLFNGPASTVGSMTSGGTESLLLAVKTYRDRARAKRPWIRRPNVVAPRTIHPAVNKAAHLFDVRLKLVDTAEDGTVDPRVLDRAIDRNTVAVFCSAPQYVTGMVDPIPEVAAIAEKRGLPMHVDACFGGFILPWLERLGVSMPEWDFRVPGVTSISADLHKYGYAPKGASVLMWRDMSFMRHQFFAATSWPGGVYISPGIPGTRPGGPIAGAWASLMAMGEQGYLAKAELALEASRKLRAGIAQIEGLRTLGVPHSTVVTWTADSDDVNVFAIADQLQQKGWSLDRQSEPPSVHCTCNASNLPVIDTYLADLAEAVDTVRQNPELAKTGEAAVYGLMARVPVKGLVKSAVLDMMEKMYDPDNTGEVNVEDDGGAVQEWATKALDAFDRIKARLSSGA